MVRVFVDANTIISGFLFKGNESQLLEVAGLGLIEMVTTDYVIREVRRAPRREEFGLSESEAGRLMRIALGGIHLWPDDHAAEIRDDSEVLKDKKDVPVLVGLRSSGSDVPVTGDREPLERVPEALRTNGLLRSVLEESTG